VKGAAGSTEDDLDPKGCPHALLHDAYSEVGSDPACGLVAEAQSRLLLASGYGTEHG